MPGGTKSRIGSTRERTAKKPPRGGGSSGSGACNHPIAHADRKIEQELRIGLRRLEQMSGQIQNDFAGTLENRAEAIEQSYDAVSEAGDIVPFEDRQ